MGSVFSHHKTVADRSASDRRRHKKKIEEAIKDGIHDIVAEESIIGQDGKKKIKIQFAVFAILKKCLEQCEKIVFHRGNITVIY